MLLSLARWASKEEESGKRELAVPVSSDPASKTIYCKVSVQVVVPSVEYLMTAVWSEQKPR